MVFPVDLCADLRYQDIEVPLFMRQQTLVIVCFFVLFHGRTPFQVLIRVVGPGLFALTLLIPFGAFYFNVKTAYENAFF